MSGAGRLIVVSNRLPITVKATDIGYDLQASSGGLVSALLPVLEERGGCWIGWTGTDHDVALAGVVKDWCAGRKYTFDPVFLTAAEKARFYRGCSNEIIWPLFHSLTSRCQFGADYWRSYRRVNEKFAGAAERIASNGDFIWVHDYHLMMVAESLRRRGVGNRLAYFHHIPFPSLDIFETLPWREEVLRGLMQFDNIGFQTQRDRDNFIGCLRHCLSNVRVWRIGERLMVRADGSSAMVGAYPISIDYAHFANESAQEAVAVQAAEIRNGAVGRRLVLGVDRLDYTKGIPERLVAFQRFLRVNPEERGRVTIVQIVIPSREEIPEYHQLKLRIEGLVSQINGEYSNLGWTPVQYMYRSINRVQLMAYYLASDVALVTPLRDGMNLVAKEFCASRHDEQGVLVLSEFAGAAQELRHGALLVNPHDADGLAFVLARALRMSEDEQRTRMRAMRSQIEAHNVFQWARSMTATSAPVAFMPKPVERFYLRNEISQTAFGQ